MRLQTIAKLIRDGKTPTLLSVIGLAASFYRACFVGAAASSGLLAKLANRPQTFDQLAEEFAPDPAARDGFRAWLQLGVRLKELRIDAQGYSLRGRLSRNLANPKNDSTAALLEELVRLDHRVIVTTPEYLRRGQKFTLADQDGVLVARSSRAVEPFVEEAIDRVLPKRGQYRLLEIGCGSGTYLRYAAQRNPQLTGVGIELQKDVAEHARRNVEEWHLGHRIVIEVADVRDKRPTPEFDLVTLHNNVYYFPTEEREKLFKHLMGFLKSDGVLLLTTGCQGGSYGLELLNLWASVTQGCGPLPTRDELTSQLTTAGFASVTARSLIPGDAYYSFLASGPKPAS